jgi:hypothetical protein
VAREHARKEERDERTRGIAGGRRDSGSMYFSRRSAIRPVHASLLLSRCEVAHSARRSKPAAPCECRSRPRSTGREEEKAPTDDNNGQHQRMEPEAGGERAGGRTTRRRGMN